MNAAAGAQAQALANSLEAELRQLADPVRATSERAYLKSELEFIGCGVPALRGVAKRFFREHRALEHATMLEMYEALWDTNVFERRMVAVELLVLFRDWLEPGNLDLVESLLRRSYTWALVDTLSEKVAGGLVERFSELAAVIDRWATDADFWVRRAALLSTLGPIRRDEGGFARFARYADTMLDEKEFFIRKAIGWVLREAGKRRPEQVFAWLAPRTDRASGITVREAIKYLPPDRAAALLAAYEERRALV